MNEDLRSKVRAGIAFLDKKIPDWLDKVGDLDTLDMRSCRDCIFCRVTKIPDFMRARSRTGLFLQQGKDYGFDGSENQCRTLTKIWIEEIRKRQQGGGKPTYPWVWKGFPARIVEENVRGVIGDKVLILYLANHEVEIPSIVPRGALKEPRSATLKVGLKFKYHGFPYMVAAIPGKQALIISPNTGGYKGLAQPFIDSNLDTFAPEDFGLDPAFVEIEQ